MLRRGLLEGPLINVYGTSKSYSVLEDFSNEQKKDARKQGIFFIKIFDKIPLNQNNANYLKISSINIDFKPINYNSEILSATAMVNGKLTSKTNFAFEHCDNLDHLIDLSGLNAYIENVFGDLTLNVPVNTTISFSEGLQKLFGLNNGLIIGPKSIQMGKIDLYQNCRPCLVMMPLLAKSFVVDNMDSLAMVLNTDKIKCFGNGSLNLTFENTQPDSWLRIEKADLQPYIMVQIKDSNGINLAFEQETEISIHFIVKTSPFDIL